MKAKPRKVMCGTTLILVGGALMQLGCGTSEAQNDRGESGEKTGEVVQSANMLQDVDTRWPDGEVPFLFYQEFIDEGRDVIAIAAMNYITARVPSITFIETELPIGGRIEFDIDVNNHTSPQGYDGNAPVNVWLTKSAPQSTAIHEIMHALGVKHEHQRPDRNPFIQEFSDKDDFDELPWEDVDPLTPYDFHSRMHYNGCAFSSFPAQCPTTPAFQTIQLQPSITDTAPDISGAQIGPFSFGVNLDMSKHDINGLLLAYPPKVIFGEVDVELGSALAVADFDMDGENDIATGLPGAG